MASPQVVNGSLQTKDLSAKARKALKGNRGLRGAVGARGAKGATGSRGPTGTQGVKGDSGATNVVTRSVSDSVAAGAVKLLQSDCNAGEKATGGGGNNVATAGVNVIQSSPEPLTGTPTGWQVTCHNTTGATHNIFAYAICASS